MWNAKSRRQEDETPLAVSRLPDSSGVAPPDLIDLAEQIPRRLAVDDLPMARDQFGGRRHQRPEAVLIDEGLHGERSVANSQGLEHRPERLRVLPRESGVLDVGVELALP